MNMTEIRFEEKYVDEENETTTLYFIAPKEMLKDYIPKKDFPEAVSMEISIEFPTEHIDANYGYVCVSPTREIEGGSEDYDWHDVQISLSEILQLIALAERTEEVKKE